MNTFWTRAAIEQGINQVDISDSGFKFIKEFVLLNLENNKRYDIAASPHETGLLILEGRCSLQIDGKLKKGIGSRDSVFSGKPTAVYIPIDTPFTLWSAKGSVAICRAACDVKTEPVVIQPDQIKVTDVGRDNWSREVRIAIGPESPSVNLIIGETINPPGNWSGTPPHKHEGDELHGESLHEELYYFKTDKPQGWGIERFYSPEQGINELIYLRENTVTFMPWGYHQIVAAPGYTLYYLFSLAGKGKELSPREDPDHNWIKQL